VFGIGSTSVVPGHTAVALHRPGRISITYAIKFQSLVLISMVGIAGAASAQQSSSTTPATSAQAPAAAATPASATSAQPQGPSADVIKEARRAGYRMKTSNGNYYFCKQDADIGTRLTTEKCMSADQLALTLQRQQMDKDQIKAVGVGGTSSK
jgi:hypothetical protein